MTDELTRRLIDSALGLAHAKGAQVFSVPVPNTRPTLWVSLHEGPVQLGQEGESAGGVPGSSELRELVQDLEQRAFAAQDLGQAQQAVLDFVSALRA